MPNVLLVLTLPEAIRNRYRDRIAAVSDDLTVDVVDHHSKVDGYIANADILVTFGPMMSDRVFADAKRLKWVQALGSGVDGITDQPSLPSGVIVTNIRGIHGAPVAEAALAAMLALARDLPRALRAQRKHAWERAPARTLDGKTVVIVGVGLISEALAPRCKALGMQVVGVSSTPRDIPGFDRILLRDALLEGVAEADHLVLLAPHTPETHHMIDARVIATMKPTSFLINLARGGVVDETALVDALRRGRIAGAALDVFTTEPLPSDNPLWDMDNVIITPHLGGFFDEYPDYALPVIEHNLRSYLAGDRADMINLVQGQDIP